MEMTHQRLAASMAVAWESEIVSSRVLAELGERMLDPKRRARLLVLSAFCRAHASRLLVRLSALGQSALPVPPIEIEVQDDTEAALQRERQRALRAALRYEKMRQMARGQADLSSAWVCELNRSEEQERAVELARLLEATGAADWPAAALPR